MNKNFKLKLFLFYLLLFFPTLLFGQNSGIYYEAVTAYNNKDYTKAVIKFDNFFEEYKFQDELYSSAKFYQSDAYLNLDELDAAEKGFLSLINGHWTSYKEESIYKLASIYFVEEKYPSSREYFNKILSDYPGSSHYGSSLYWVGESYMKEDNVEDAISFLENSIAKKNNKYIDKSIFSLALAYEKTGDYKKAVENYDKLLSFYSSSPLAVQAQVRIGICYFKLKDYQSSILELNNPVLENLPKEKYAEGLYLLANSYYRAEEYKDAEKTYSEVIKNFEDSELYNESLYGLAWTYFQQKRYNEAYKIFNNLSKNSDSLGINSFFYKAEAKRYAGRDNEAYKIYNDFIDNYPDNILADNAGYQLAVLNYNNKKFDKAEYYLESSVSSKDNVVRSKSLILSGDINLQQNKIPEAQKKFRDASRIKGVDNSLILRARLGDGISKYYLKQYDEVINLLKDVLSKGALNEKDKINYYIAESYFKQDKYKEAIEYYNKIESNSNLYDASVYGKGYSYFNQRDFVNASEYFEQFIKNNPKDIKYEDAYLRLADSYYGSKRYSAAIDIYKKFFNTEKKVNDPFTNFQYAQALYKAGKNSEAISELYALQTKYPQSEYAAKAQFFIGWINFQQNNYPQALVTFREAIYKYPGNNILPQVYYTMGDTYFNIGKFDSAIVYYKKVISDYPNSPSANDALNSLQQSYTSMGRTDLAISTINDYVEKNNTKNSDELMFKKGEIYFNSDEYSLAKESFQQFIVGYPTSKLLPDAYYWLGKISEQMNQSNEAIINYSYVVDNYSQSEIFLTSARELAELYTQQKQYIDVIKVYDKILSKNLNGEEKAEILFLKASALAENSNLDAAGDIFFSILQEHTETIYAERAKLELGMISLAKSDYETAESYFKNLAETRNDELGARAQYYLGILYLEQQQYEEALTNFVRVNTNFSEHDEWVTSSYLKMGECYTALNDMEKAKEMYKIVLQKHPKDVYGKEAQNKLRGLK